MKATGIVRKLDELGRVVLPIDLRRKFDIDLNDPIDIGVNGNEIVLTKHVPHCIFCKGTDMVKEVIGKNICEGCLTDLQAM